MSSQIGRVFVSGAACVVLLCGVAGCGDKKPAGMATDTTTAVSTMASGADAQAQKNTEMSRMFVEEVINKGNMAYIDQAIAPDFIEHTPSPGQQPGIEGLRKMMTEMRASMPDIKSTVLNIVAQGDIVMMQTSMSGTQSGPMMGMPATGKKMDVTGVDVLRIKDGKAVEHWGYAEEMKMMMQLGMMPPMDGMPAPTAAPGGAKPPAGGTGAAAGQMDSTGKADTSKDAMKK